jgi:hypothetical protein
MAVRDAVCVCAGSATATALQAFNGCNFQDPVEGIMQALKELFTTDVGLLSMGGILFMLGMGVFYLRFFLRHMHEDEAKARAARR